MKFIRNWFKKLIIEAVKESFPPCDITIIDSEKSNIKLKIEGGTFVDSEIKISKEFSREDVIIKGANVEQNQGIFIHHGVDLNDHI